MKTPRLMRWAIFSSLILLFVIGQACLALAHANLVRSEPAAGGNAASGAGQGAA